MREELSILYIYIERRQREEKKNDDQIKTPAHALFSQPPRLTPPLNHPQTHSTTRQPNEINELLRRGKKPSMASKAAYVMIKMIKK